VQFHLQPTKITRRIGIHINFLGQLLLIQNQPSV
jgi:hypothetical protein